MVPVLGSLRLFRLAKTNYRNKPNKLRRINRSNSVHVGRNQNFKAQPNQSGKSATETTTTTTTTTNITTDTATDTKTDTTATTAKNSPHHHSCKFHMHSPSRISTPTPKITRNTRRMPHMQTRNPMHEPHKLTNTHFITFSSTTHQVTPPLPYKNLKLPNAKCKGLVRGYPSQV
jgi:hypothetical protein